MRLPNGFGNVSILPGNRRKPYHVRVTVGWAMDEKAGTCKQKFKTIGYYETRQEGLIALSNYHQNPYEGHKQIYVGYPHADLFRCKDWGIAGSEKGKRQPIRKMV